MPPEDLVDHLNKIALEGIGELSTELLRFATIAPEYFPEAIDHPTAEMGRFFANEPRLAPIRPALHAAAVQGALTWCPEPTADVARGVAFILRSFSSPEVAVAIARRMNGLKPTSPIFMPTSPAAGHLIETAALQAASSTVRARLLDLFRNVRFSKFYAIIFIQIVRLDANSIPLFIDRMLEFAPTYPAYAGDRPAYMIGFDNQLNLIDVENIVAHLNGQQSQEFGRLFLFHSQAFTQSPEGIVEVRRRREHPPAVTPAESSPSPLVGTESQRHGHDAEIFLGRLRQHLANPKIIYNDLAMAGVKTRPMFIAPSTRKYVDA